MYDRNMKARIFALLAIIAIELSLIGVQLNNIATELKQNDLQMQKKAQSLTDAFVKEREKVRK